MAKIIIIYLTMSCKMYQSISNQIIILDNLDQIIKYQEIKDNI